MGPEALLGPYAIELLAKPLGIQQDSTTLPSRLEVQWRSGVDIEKACAHVHTLPEKGRCHSGMATVDRAE